MIGLRNKRDENKPIGVEATRDRLLSEVESNGFRDGIQPKYRAWYGVQQAAPTIENLWHDLAGIVETTEDEARLRQPNLRAAWRGVQLPLQVDGGVGMWHIGQCLRIGVFFVSRDNRRIDDDIVHKVCRHGARVSKPVNLNCGGF